MTIKIKNRLIFFLIFISMALIITGLLTTGIFFFTGHIAQPSSLPVLPLQSFFIFRYRFFCSLSSIFVLLAYSFITLIVINIEFEKTQSSEIIFLAIFFIGCFLESARLAFPIFNLWESKETASILASRLVLAGRVICTASILFSAAYSGTEYRQYVEQNIAIIFVLGLVIANFYPLNTNYVLPEGHFAWGFSNLLVTSQRFIMFLTFFLQLRLKKGDKKNRNLAAGILLLALGYSFLVSASNIFFLAGGALLIISGTHLYIKTLHSIYLWND